MQVVVGVGDPNPLVASEGIKTLETAGIEVGSCVMIIQNQFWIHNCTYLHRYASWMVRKEMHAMKSMKTS
jgi:pyrimidine deaminase RibD-like protein